MNLEILKTLDLAQEGLPPGYVRPRSSYFVRRPTFHENRTYGFRSPEQIAKRKGYSASFDERLLRTGMPRPEVHEKFCMSYGYRKTNGIVNYGYNL